MKNKYEHLLNLNKQRIVMICGVPGSGKSTIANDFKDVGYLIFCPDTYRGIISKTKTGREHWTDAMHESDQYVSAEAWNMAYKEMQKAINNGNSVVFDAMLQTQKSRRSFFGQLNKVKVPFYSIYVDVELETAKMRNAKRAENGGRFVPEFVIEEKWRVQVFPQLEEGFTETIIINNDLKDDMQLDEITRTELINSIIENPRGTITSMKDNGVLKDFFPSLDSCWDLNQHNVHHNLPLHEHMIRAAEIIENRSPVAVISALLHDVGKQRTKEFFVKITGDNEYGLRIGEKVVAVKDNGIAVTVRTRSYQGKKGTSESLILLPLDIVEKDMNAHYYDHENVGAILARRDLIALGFDDEFVDEVYRYIVFHMELPYNLSSKSSMQRLIKKVGKDRMDILFAIRKADKLSGNTDPEFLNIHSEMIKQVKQIIRNE